MGILPKYQTKIIKRNGQSVLFEREKITNAIYKAAVSVRGSDYSLAVQLTDKVIRLLNQVYPLNSLPTVEEIQDIIEKVLMDNGHARTAKAFILYRAEQTRKRSSKESNFRVEDNVPYKHVWKSYVWNVDHHCDSVENLNRHLQDGTWKKLVLDSERHLHSEIKKAAQFLLKKKQEVRIMLLAGPSSSGKTTTTYKIGEQIQREGYSFVILNLDNYFKDLESNPKDEYGDYDFEGPEALDLDLIQDHLRSLLKGKKISVPRYDFKSGRRVAGEDLSLKNHEILLIDSLHGLYPALTKGIPSEQKFEFYMEALCQIKDHSGNFVRWTDLRLLRRMNRDSRQRGSAPYKTVGHWHYVRRSEKKYIVPYIQTAEFIFNSALPYELSVHKVFLEDEFLPILDRYRKDEKKLDACIRAERVYELLKSCRRFPEIDFIPKDSLLREFIGGGVYHY